MIDPSNPNNSIQLGGGLITVNRQFGSNLVTSYFLSRLGVVSITGGGQAELPGYWAGIPNVGVGFTSIGTYSPDINSDQEISVSMADFGEVSSGVYGGSIKAELFSVGNTASIDAGETKSWWRGNVEPMSDYEWFTTPARGYSVTAVTATFSVGSDQPWGNDGLYFKRTVRVYLQRASIGGTSWTDVGLVGEVVAPPLFKDVEISKRLTVAKGDYDLRFKVTFTGNSSYINGPRDCLYGNERVRFNGGIIEVDNAESLYDGSVVMMGVGI